MIRFTKGNAKKVNKLCRGWGKNKWYKAYYLCYLHMRRLIFSVISKDKVLPFFMSFVIFAYSVPVLANNAVLIIPNGGSTYASRPIIYGNYSTFYEVSPPVIHVHAPRYPFPQPMYIPLYINYLQTYSPFTFSTFTQVPGEALLLPWSYISEILTLHTPFKVYDIGTSLTYYMYSFSNGKHADVRPVTYSDTATLFYTFGKEWSWDVRPILVTIGDLTIAASINGFPHGDTEANGNGMVGHVCIHFFGSNVHNGNVDFAQLHQYVAQNAYYLTNSTLRNILRNSID